MRQQSKRVGKVTNREEAIYAVSDSLHKTEMMLIKATILCDSGNTSEEFYAVTRKVAELRDLLHRTTLAIYDRKTANKG